MFCMPIHSIKLLIVFFFAIGAEILRVSEARRLYCSKSRPTDGGVINCSGCTLGSGSLILVSPFYSTQIIEWLAHVRFIININLFKL